MSCVTGSTVTLSSSVDGVVGTGLCALGTVTITSSTLTEGAATMTATQTDVGGNVSVASAGLGVVIDATADAAPGTPDMTAGTDSGSSNSDSNTSDTTPDFTMSCVTGSTVTLSSSVDGVVGSGLCALGTVTITSSTLTEGAATMTATQTDVGGNVSVASAGLGVVIDATAPGAPIGAPDLQSGSDTGSSNRVIIIRS
jgi:predicted thioesterase